MVESLNQVVYQQTRRIDQLEAMLAKLADHVRDNGASGGAGGAHEKPPHY